MWTVIGVGALLWPAATEDGTLGINPDKRIWIVGFCVLLVGYNLVRSWLVARGRRVREESRRAEAEVGRSAAWLRRHAEREPPNPDFDFSERDRHDPSGPKPV